MRKLLPLILSLFLVWSASANEGIEIRPDEDGSFEFADDFQSPRFLVDGLVSGYRPNSWAPGHLRNQGPGSWSLLYRFYGQRAIRGFDITIEQSANGPNLGGRNGISVSKNGLDWHHAASSSSLKPNAAFWQQGPLSVSSNDVADVLGDSELWVRLDLSNYSGLSTTTSSSISDLKVKLTLGEPGVTAADPQAELRQSWGQLRRASQWQEIALDIDDPPEHRPPHYFEDADGWLRAPGEQELFDPDYVEELRVRRAQGDSQRIPLALVTFLRCESKQNATERQKLMARITVSAGRDASREMAVLWNDRSVGQFDAASYFQRDKTFMVALPVEDDEPHELRIVGNDGREVPVRRITVAGDRNSKPRWATKPELPQGGKLEVLSAYYMPDPRPPLASQAVQGRNTKFAVGVKQPHVQRLYQEHRDFGGVRVVLRNSGNIPLRISDRIELNGQLLEDHYVDFAASAWDARGVVWYRVRPRLVAPGECAEFYVRFRRRPSGESGQLRIHVDNGEPIEVAVPYVDPRVSIDYVTTNKDRDTLFVYARRSGEAQPGKAVAITLDGRPQPNAKVYGADYPGGVALVTAKLAEPLQIGDYHVAGVETGAGSSIAAQFRVLPWFFPRSSIHVPSDIAEEMNMNLLMWNQRSLEECNRYDLDTTSLGVFGGHPRVRYVLGPDEPDAHDNRGGGYDIGLGAIARKLADNGWQQLVQRFAPQASSWIIMNGTTRPLNWSVYGQLADISCFDPYPVSYYSADHAYVRESLMLAQRCGAPHRTYGCMEAFGWNPGPGGSRGPIPAEYRQNIVQAIGSGIKGLTSWVHSGAASGWQNNDACREEIAKVNKLIEYIEDDLLLATPIDLAASDAGEVMTGVAAPDGTTKEVWPKQRVWVGSLLSGPHTLVLAAVNHIPASKPDPPRIEPARNVTIRVTLPTYLADVSAFEATEEGLSPIACQIDDDTATITLDEIRSGRVFVLRRR